MTQTQHKSQTSTLSADSLSIIEATLASGSLAGSAPGGESTGRKWRVRVFEYGYSKNRYPWNGNSGSREWGMGNGDKTTPYSPLPTPHSPPSIPHSLLPLLWTERSAREAVRHLEGARCFADHASDNPACSVPHSVRDLVGFYSQPQLGGRGPEATLTLLESERWAREKLLAAWQAGRAGLIGFSVDAVIGVRPVGDGPSRALAVEDIVAIHSVDMVSAPSSGGRALDVLEAHPSRDRSRGPQDAAVSVLGWREGAVSCTIPGAESARAGAVVQVSNARDFATSLRYLLQNPPVRNRIGEAARRLLEKELNPTDRILEELERLLDSRPSGLGQEAGPAGEMLAGTVPGRRDRKSFGGHS